MRPRSAKWTKFLEKCHLVRDISIFWALPGGSRTWKGAFALQDNITWLVETDIAFSVEEKHFIGTSARQIYFKSACAFSGNFCTKSWISRGPVVRSWWKAVQLELRPCRLWLWKREVQENSVARERLAPRLAKLTKFSEKCPLVRDISIFWALPGAHAPGRVHSPFKTISHGS